MSERFTASCVDARVLRAPRPLPAPSFDLRERFGRVECRWRRLVRRVPGQHERYALALLHGDRPVDVLVVELERRRGPEHQRVGRGDQLDVGVGPRDPRPVRAVAEPDRQGDVDRDGAFEPFDDADQRVLAAAEGHEVDETHHAAVALEVRLQDQGPRPVATLYASHGDAGMDRPAPVLVAAEERRHARVGVEAWDAQPVHRSVARHERGAMLIAEKTVAFDVGCHGRRPRADDVPVTG